MQFFSLLSRLYRDRASPASRSFAETEKTSALLTGFR
jgi:hypothetical protein